MSVTRRVKTSDPGGGFIAPGSTDPHWTTIAALVDIADEIAELRRTVALGALVAADMARPRVAPNVVERLTEAAT